MKVGDIRRETPSVDSTVMLEDRQPWLCEVVYIHPKWRFYTVEFTTVLGWKFRESFFFRDKRPDGPELPEEIRREREMPKFDCVRRGTHRAPRRSDAWRPIYS